MVKHSASYYFYRDNDEIELVKREFPDYIKKDIKKHLKNKWLSLDPLIKSEYEKRYLEQESENELMLVDFGNLECDPIPKTTEIINKECKETPTKILNKECKETPTKILNKECKETPTEIINKECKETPTEIINKECKETPTKIINKECKELKPHSSFWFYHRTYPNQDLNSLLEKWETMNLLEKEPWENMSFRENINIRLNNLEIMLDKLN